MPKESLPSQDFVTIKDIKNDVVFLTSGGLRKVLLVSGINTELKSEEEQNAVYFLFQNFLNSVDFPLQFVTHSRKLNIEEYLEYLKSKQREETNELLKSGIEEYNEFIKSFVQENAIMAKNFFTVVPYDPIIIPGKAKIKKSLPFLKKSETNEEEKGSEEQITQLNQRADQIISLLHGVGLRAVALNTEELTELFYNLYNPESVEKRLA